MGGLPGLCDTNWSAAYNGAVARLSTTPVESPQAGPFPDGL